MLSDLMSKPKAKPPIITIVGTPGVGKTSLAGMFPKPVFIQAEDSSTVFEQWDEEIQPAMLPKLKRARYNQNGVRVQQPISTKHDMLGYLRMLIDEEHDRETLVIDSITTLHSMFEHEICEMYNVDNVAEAAGGFHKGYLVASEMHGEIKNACDILRERKNMTIVFLAHCGVQRIKNRPDADEYTVYTLDMNEKSVHNYVNLVDGVFYLRNEEFVKGNEKNKKGQVTKWGQVVQTGDRVLVTSGDGKVGYVNAKTRYPMDVEIPVPIGENPLLELIPFFAKNTDK